MCCVKTFSIICNRNIKEFFGKDYTYIYFFCCGVFDNVVDQFLENSEQDEFFLCVQFYRLTFNVELWDKDPAFKNHFYFIFNRSQQTYFGHISSVHASGEIAQILNSFCEQLTTIINFYLRLFGLINVNRSNV